MRKEVVKVESWTPLAELSGSAHESLHDYIFHDMYSSNIHVLTRMSCIQFHNFSNAFTVIHRVLQNIKHELEFSLHTRMGQVQAQQLSSSAAVAAAAEVMSFGV